MDRKIVGKILVGAPTATIAVGTFASAWEGAKAWIGSQFAALGQAMANPFVTMLVTLFVVAYALVTLWCFLEPKLTSGADIRAAEASKERDRKRGMLDKCRSFAATYTQGHTGFDTFRQYLEGTKTYAAVRGYLSDEYLAQLNDGNTVHAMKPGARYDPLIEMFLDELDRLEGEWGLR